MMSQCPPQRFKPIRQRFVRSKKVENRFFSIQPQWRPSGVCFYMYVLKGLMHRGSKPSLKSIGPAVYENKSEKFNTLTDRRTDKQTERHTPQDEHAKKTYAGCSSKSWTFVTK